MLAAWLAFIVAPGKRASAQESAGVRVAETPSAAGEGPLVAFSKGREEVIGTSSEELVRVDRRSLPSASPPSTGGATGRVAGALRVDAPGAVGESPAAPSLDRSPPEGTLVPRAGALHRRRESSRPPWVAVHSLTPPRAETERLFRAEGELRGEEPWYLVDRERLEFADPPRYVQFDPPPLFYIEMPDDSRYTRAFKTVLRKKLYSELRRRAKRSWREVYASRPRMTYTEYEDRLLAINRLGRESSDYDPFHDDYYTSELKEDLFGESYAEGESDIPLVAWGPFVITDRGSMRVELARVAEIARFVEEPDKLEIESGEQPKKPFLASEDYRIHTNLRLHFDPVGPISEGDATWLIKRYGVAVTVDWLSDVLGTELLSAEVEAEVDRDGDFGVAVNFVIRSRE